MKRIDEITPVHCDVIPNELENGKLYISLEFGTAVHLCACGCGQKTVTRLQPCWRTGWTLTENNGAVSLRPSIGNFSGEKPYHAHYFITNNKVIWA